MTVSKTTVCSLNNAISSHPHIILMAGWMHEIKSMSWQGPFSFLGAFFGNQRTRSLLKLSTAERVSDE